MTEKRKYTQAEFELIKAHNDTLIEASQEALRKWRSVPVAERDKQIISSIEYWKHAIGALNWSTGQAAQRLKGFNSGRPTAV